MCRAELRLWEGGMRNIPQVAGPAYLVFPEFLPHHEMARWCRVNVTTFFAVSDNAYHLFHSQNEEFS